MKKLIVTILVTLLFISGCSVRDLFVKENQKGGDYLSGKINAQINVQDYGVIELELDADTAPITVTNFVNLAKSGFYDGLTFHRIMENFMIQGGDPSHDGTGGSSETIKGEFQANGVKNDISHKRGVISMARASYSMDSASSQFFIVQKDYPSLDGEYAAFGHVTSGMEVVDKIASTLTPYDENGEIMNNGLVDLELQPTIESIKIIE